MSEYDPSKPPIVISLECTRDGQRQTIHLHLARESEWDTLRQVFILSDLAYVEIRLKNDQLFILDLASVWYAYRLPSSYVYPSDTLILGDPNE